MEITALSVSLTPVWEGLADRRWSAPELVQLQADLARFDVLADLAATFRGERAYDLHGIDYMQRHRDLKELLGIIHQPGIDDDPNSAEKFAYLLLPAGWFELNKATAARDMQHYLIEGADPKRHRVLVERFETIPPDTYPVSPSNFLVGNSFQVFRNMGLRAARLQTGLDQAVTSCALERFFLARQTYPARLDELIPTYLSRVPTDVIDGAPLRYHSTPDGRYQLYGVGWNQRDDGGQVAWDQDAHQYSPAAHLDKKEGDWVWQYTDLQPPPPPPSPTK